MKTHHATRRAALALAAGTAFAAPPVAGADPAAPVAVQGVSAGTMALAPPSWVEREFNRFRAHARFDRAFRLVAAKRLNDAARDFGDGLALDPEHVPARLGYAQLLASRGDHASALTHLNEVMARDRSSLPALKLRAQSHAASFALPAAIADHEAVAAHPAASTSERRFAMESAADLHLRLGRYAQALALLDRLSPDGDSADNSARRAYIYERTDRSAEAAAAYRDAAERSTDPVRRAQWTHAAQVAHTGVHAHAATDTAPATLLKTGRDPAASAGSRPRPADASPRASIASPPASEAAQAMARGYVHLTARRHAAAAQAFGHAAALGGDVRAMQEQVLALDRAGQRQDAIAAARRLVLRHPEPSHRLQLAHLLARTGGADEATALLDALAAPDQAEATRLPALRALAVLQAQRGDAAQARAALERLLTIEPDHAATHATLARAQLEAGDSAAAALSAQRSLELNDHPDTLRLLAFAQSRAGDWTAVVQTCERLLAQRGLRAADRQVGYGQLAFALDALGRYQESASVLERAIAEPGGGSVELHERLAHALLQVGDTEGVAITYTQALSSPEASATQRRSLRHRLAALQQSLGRSEEAIATYRFLLAAQPEDARARLALGALLRARGDWPQAEPLLTAALERGAEPAAALELAYGHKAEGRVADAIGVLQQAQAAAQNQPALRKKLLDELGYLHEARNDPGRAAAAWQLSLSLQQDPRIALAWADVQWRMGQRAAARTALEALPDLAAPDHARQLDLLWQIENAEGRHTHAFDAAVRAMALEPSTERRFRVGLSEHHLGRWSAAIAQLEQVVAEDGKTAHLDALAYAYRAGERYPQAARAFETLLQRDPQRTALYADLAYTYMRGGDNDRALDWFKRAIDKRLERGPGTLLAQAGGASTPPAAEAQAEAARREDEQLRAMRDEVRKLSERWSLSAYQSLRGRRGERPSTVSSGGNSTGVIPSQGGIELSWRPPGIGLRDDRTFDVIARVLWSNEPRSLEIDGDSTQAGLGVRYKPLREHSLYLSAERLFKIGDNAQNDWLVRASYGWSSGYEMRTQQDHWNYTSLFVDVGRFTDDARTRSVFVEGRQGRSFRFGERWILTPHAVVDGRHQSPDPDKANYAEAGLGVSARYVFNESKYATPRSSAEFLLQYKRGFSAAKSGWVFTTVARF